MSGEQRQRSPIPPSREVGAQVIPVIEVKFRRGEGVEDDPVRIVTAYFSVEGALLAERDSWTAETKP